VRKEEVFLGNDDEPRVVGNSLDHFFETWSAEEEEEFLKAIEIFERTDESL
jgi:hypothetical protein